MMTAPVVPAALESKDHVSKGPSRSAEKELDEVHMEVNVLKVEGVPYEDDSRSNDVISRGVRFCVVQTDKVGSVEKGPGNPPVFLSNVTKLSATPRQKKRDIWDFAPVDGHERACFVRAAANASYERPEDTSDESASAGTTMSRRTRQTKGNPLDELYLFIELTSK